jgi:hypothetical protein
MLRRLINWLLRKRDDKIYRLMKVAANNIERVK